MDREYIEALIDLHRGLDYKGPGDRAFSLGILKSLAQSPKHPIADLGCGSGASALLLAQYYQSTVMAVDASVVFIEELKVRAKQTGLDQFIIPIHGDMAKLDWEVGSLDLLWSEGAAYNLGFEQALKIWRPLLADQGVAVLSEMTWFTDDVPKPARNYWQAAYPTMGTRRENIDRANRSGFSLLATHQLPSQAWWDNYCNPLRERIESLETSPISQSVILEMKEEMELFEKFSDYYGYMFYVLQAS